MNVYRGFREYNGCYVLKGSEIFDHRPSLEVWNHSPCGYEWGYQGSGPAQLALALLLEVSSPEIAQYYHQDFKRAIIGVLDYDEWRLAEEAILGWLLLARAKHEVGPLVSLTVANDS